MALPLIFVPSGLPLPLARGHGQAIDDQFDLVPVAQGEGRKRRIYTTSNRTVDLIWLLTEEQMLLWDAWYEDTLDRGNRTFACPVHKLGASDIEYWTGQFIEPPNETPIASPTGLWEISVSVLLTGSPSDTLPDTGVLALAVVVSLGGTAVLYVPNPLSLDISVSLGTTIGLSLDIYVSLGIPVPPVDGGNLERIWMHWARTPIPGDEIDRTDAELLERAWVRW